MKSRKAEVSVAVIVAIVALGAVVGLWAVPTFFSGQNRRAKQSTQATAQLESAAKAQLEAVQTKAAHAAAGVATIQRASADLPPSPATEFVRAETPVVLAKLPPPDPVALLEAEKRRSAYMEGKYELAKSLYASESERSTKLSRDLASRTAELDRAFAERREVDLKLERAAAAEIAERRQKMIAGAVAAALGLAWIWLRLNSLSIARLGKMAKDIRDGENALKVLDQYTPLRLWKKVNKNVRLNTEPPDNSQPANPAQP